MSKTTTIVLAVVGGFAGFIALIITIAFMATSGPVKAVEAELELLKSGPVQEAYEALATGFRETVPQSDFERFLATYPSFTKNQKVSFSSRDVSGDESTLRGTLTDTDGGVTPVQIRLVKENGAWRILSIEILTSGIQVID
ncbi:DUF4864 domain-containing protein [Patescibacteria group bacterium]|nr:DUF4864 domain-containing protein [Patescibacteria group bacterium]MBU1449020.1 DUF4864 domain-containing protein [Patescibacteria group bacterium]MBU2613016.1 DUF4864 domain-containing protein [Patescibacteria group bacterium]